MEYITEIKGKNIIGTYAELVNIISKMDYFHLVRIYKYKRIPKKL